MWRYVWAVASTRTCRRNAWRPDHVPDQAGGRRSGPAGSRQLSRRDGGGAAAAAGLNSRVTLEAAGCPFFCAGLRNSYSIPPERERASLAPSSDRFRRRRRLRGSKCQRLGDMRSNRIVARHHALLRRRYIIGLTIHHKSSSRPIDEFLRRRLAVLLRVPFHEMLGPRVDGFASCLVGLDLGL